MRRRAPGSSILSDAGSAVEAESAVAPTCHRLRLRSGATDSFACTATGLAPQLGKHTHEVLREIGINNESIDDLAVGAMLEDVLEE